MEQATLTADVIETLNLPAYPDLGDLVIAVEEKYGKPLVFEEGTVDSLGEGVTGHWIDTPEPWHRQLPAGCQGLECSRRAA